MGTKIIHGHWGQISEPLPNESYTQPALRAAWTASAFLTPEKVSVFVHLRQVTVMQRILSRVPKRTECQAS